MGVSTMRMNVKLGENGYIDRDIVVKGASKEPA
jgi:hypothetical protein